MAKKTGANKADQARIRRLKAKGMSAEDISHYTKVNLKTVKIFMDFVPVVSVRFVDDGHGNAVSVPKDWKEGDPIEGVSTSVPERVVEEGMPPGMTEEDLGSGEEEVDDKE